MPHTAVFGRIGAMYLSAALNAVALVALLASSDVLSGKSPHVHQAFVGSIGWFGIGVLFSGAAVIFYHFTRHYYGEGGGGDLVRVATPVASIMSFLLFILGMWESAPLIRNVGLSLSTCALSFIDRNVLGNDGAGQERAIPAVTRRGLCAGPLHH